MVCCEYHIDNGGLSSVPPSYVVCEKVMFSTMSFCLFVNSREKGAGFPRPVQTYLLGLRLKDSVTSASLHAVLHPFLPPTFPSGSYCTPIEPSMNPSVPLCTTAHPNVPSQCPLNVPLHPFTSNHALLQPILMFCPSAP